MSVPRRRFSELLKLYQLTPAVRDVFVEGPTDKVIMEYVLGEARPFGSMVRWIDEIEIDVGNFTGIDGAKGRVVHITTEADRACLSNVIGVVDRNMDGILPLDRRGSLHPTLYPDIEFHIVRRDSVRTLLTLSAAKDVPESCITSAIVLAKRLYSIRSFAHNNDLPCALPSVRKSVSLKDDELCFDLEDYLSRVDSRNKCGQTFSGSVGDVEKIYLSFADVDDFMYVNFHEFEGICEVAMRMYGISPPGFFSVDWLGRVFRSALTTSVELDEFFHCILRRVNT